MATSFEASAGSSFVTASPASRRLYSSGASLTCCLTYSPNRPGRSRGTCCAVLTASADHMNPTNRAPAVAGTAVGMYFIISPHPATDADSTPPGFQPHVDPELVLQSIRPISARTHTGAEPTK